MDSLSSSGLSLWPWAEVSWHWGMRFFSENKSYFGDVRTEWAPVKARLGWPQKISLGQGFNRSLHQEAPGSSLNSQTRMWKFTRWFQIQQHWAYLLISRLKHIKFSPNLHAVHTFPIAQVHFLVFRLLAPWIRQILEDPFLRKLETSDNSTAPFGKYGIETYPYISDIS